MNISGILVVVPPPQVEATIRLLRELSGVEVHHVDRRSGRLVVTQEKSSVGEEVDGLQRIKALPNIILAEMVQHFVEPEGEDGEGDSPVGSEEMKPRIPPLLEE